MITLLSDRPPPIPLPADSSSLELTLRSLRPILSDPNVTELCINGPGEAFIETRRRLAAVCVAVLRTSTGASAWRSSWRTPTASASMKNPHCFRHRCPAASVSRSSCRPRTTQGHVAITIRRPADEVWSIEELAQRGIFRRRATRDHRAPTRQNWSCCDCWKLMTIEEFMRLAVKARKNIVVSGPTEAARPPGQSAIREIPSEERLITIEDAEGAGARSPSEPCPAVLQQGRSGPRTRDAEAAAQRAAFA